MTLVEAYAIINASEGHRVLNCRADFGGRDMHLITPRPNPCADGVYRDTAGVIRFAKTLEGKK